MKMICPAREYCEGGCVGYGWPIQGYHNEPHTKEQCDNRGKGKCCGLAECVPCADNGEPALLCPECRAPITTDNIGSFRVINGIITGVICKPCFIKIQIEHGLQPEPCFNKIQEQLQRKDGGNEQ